MIYQRMFNERNTTGVTSREGIDYLPVYMNSALIFNGVRVSQFLVFWEVFCRSMFAFLSIFVTIMFSHTSYTRRVFDCTEPELALRTRASMKNQHKLCYAIPGFSRME